MLNWSKYWKLGRMRKSGTEIDGAARVITWDETRELHFATHRGARWGGRGGRDTRYSQARNDWNGRGGRREFDSRGGRSNFDDRGEFRGRGPFVHPDRRSQLGPSPRRREHRIGPYHDDSYDRRHSDETRKVELDRRNPSRGFAQGGVGIVDITANSPRRGEKRVERKKGEEEEASRKKTKSGTPNTDSILEVLKASGVSVDKLEEVRQVLSEKKGSSFRAPDTETVASGEAKAAQTTQPSNSKTGEPSTPTLPPDFGRTIANEIVSAMAPMMQPMANLLAAPLMMHTQQAQTPLLTYGNTYTAQQAPFQGASSAFLGQNLRSGISRTQQDFFGQSPNTQYAHTTQQQSSVPFIPSATQQPQIGLQTLTRMYPQVEQPQAGHGQVQNSSVGQAQVGQAHLAHGLPAQAQLAQAQVAQAQRVVPYCELPQGMSVQVVPRNMSGTQAEQMKTSGIPSVNSTLQSSRATGGANRSDPTIADLQAQIAPLQGKGNYEQK